MAKKIELKISEGEELAAYVYLPDHPGAGTHGASVRQILLREIYPDYKGVDLYFDFDRDNRLIGIEVLAE